MDKSIFLRNGETIDMPKGAKKINTVIIQKGERVIVKFVGCV